MARTRASRYNFSFGCRNHERRSCMCCLTLLVIVLDFMCDWSQFLEVTIENEHEKTGKDFWWAMLAFCIWGTVTFIVEMILLFTTPASLRILDLLTVWTEDVPLIILTAFFAHHHPKVGGLFQIMKAVAAILEALAKGMTACCTSCSDDLYRNPDRGDHNTCCGTAVTCITVLGYLSTLTGAIVTIVFCSL